MKHLAAKGSDFSLRKYQENKRELQGEHRWLTLDSLLEMWMDGWMDGWIEDRSLNSCIIFSLLLQLLFDIHIYATAAFHDLNWQQQIFPYMYRHWREKKYSLKVFLKTFFAVCISQHWPWHYMWLKSPKKTNWYESVSPRRRPWAITGEYAAFEAWRGPSGTMAPAGE